MVKKEDVVQLSKVHSLKEEYLSVFLNVDSKEGNVLEKEKVFLRNSFRKLYKSLEKKRKPVKYLERDERKIYDILEKGVAKRKRGLAIFISSQEGFFKKYELSFPFKNFLYYGHSLFIRPLLYLVSDYEPTIVLLLDSRVSKFFESYQDYLDLIETIETDVPKKVLRGGWSQTRFQRHSEELLERHLKKTADYLSRIVNGRNFPSFILVGQNVIIEKLRTFLPKRVLEREIAHSKIRRGIWSSKKRIMKIAFDALKKKSDETNGILVRKLKDSQYTLTEIENIIEAVNRGRVELLLLSRTFRTPGFACRKCQTIFHRRVLICPFCQSPVDRVDLGDVMARRVLASGGEVRFVFGNKEFKKIGGAGVFLRFKP